MQVNNSSSTLKLAIQTDILKKSEDVVQNQIGYILEKNLGNPKEIEQKAAQATGKGINLNIQG